MNDHEVDELKAYEPEKRAAMILWAERLKNTLEAALSPQFTPSDKKRTKTVNTRIGPWPRVCTYSIFKMFPSTRS